MKSNKLSCKQQNKLKKTTDEKVLRQTTPVKQTERPVDRDYSPVFLPCTQETLDTVDVLWDWNSPQSKMYHAKKTKRKVRVPSPKPKKPQPPIHHKTFDKLEEEMRAFRQEILSERRPHFDEADLACNNNELDPFDDSMEDQLILVSQAIEEKLERGSPAVRAKASPRNFLTKSFSSHVLESTSSPVKANDAVRPSNFKTKLQELRNETNDSFDEVLVNFKDDDITETQKMPETKPASAPTTNNSVLKMKTKSLSFGDHYDAARTNLQKEEDARLRKEIEQRRLEALAKLRAKSKQKQETSDSDTSPIKCSPDEIRLKRQMALAKLEAKKKQELIERNRQEALKRLELSRKKHGLTCPGGQFARPGAR